MIEDLFPHAELVPDAVGRAVMERVREASAFERYPLVDRGSYEVGVPPDELVRELLAIASRRLERPLGPRIARVLRLRAGDYILARHDPLGEADSRGFELVFDVSRASAPAEVHYRRRGQVFFRVPSVPGTLAIVELTPTVTRNHTYVSRLAANAEVTRVIVRA